MCKKYHAKLLSYIKWNLSLSSNPSGPTENSAVPSTAWVTKYNTVLGSWESSRSFEVSRLCGHRWIAYVLRTEFRIKCSWICSIVSKTFWRQECCIFPKLTHFRRVFQITYELTTPNSPRMAIDILHEGMRTSVTGVLSFYPSIMRTFLPQQSLHFWLISECHFFFLPSINTTPFLLQQEHCVLHGAI